MQLGECIAGLQWGSMMVLIMSSASGGGLVTVCWTWFRLIAMSGCALWTTPPCTQTSVPSRKHCWSLVRYNSSKQTSLSSTDHCYCFMRVANLHTWQHGKQQVDLRCLCCQVQVYVKWMLFQFSLCSWHQCYMSMSHEDNLHDGHKHPVALHFHYASSTLS